MLYDVLLYGVLLYALYYVICSVFRNDVTNNFRNDTDQTTNIFHIFIKKNSTLDNCLQSVFPQCCLLQLLHQSPLPKNTSSSNESTSLIFISSLSLCRVLVYFDSWWFPGKMHGWRSKVLNMATQVGCPLERHQRFDAILRLQKEKKRSCSLWLGGHR